MKSREIKKFRKTYTKYTYDCISEGYKLAVLFDEKDEVKQYGGRWHPVDTLGDGGGYWWMPAKHINDEIHDNGYLVRQWLNDHEMIMGQHGKVDQKSHVLGILENPVEYELLHQDSTTTWCPDNCGVFHVWDSIGICLWGSNDEKRYMTLDDGRSMWDDLMSAGYRKITREKTLTLEEDSV